MNMEAFMSKLKELKMKMAELESMEESEGCNEMAEVMGEEKPEMMASAPEKEESLDEKLSDDDIMEAFGKKKKMPPKAGMKVAMMISKPKMKPAMGKYK